MSPRDLPPEILISILVFLSARDISSCKLVCRDFNELINSTSLLQYLFQLRQAGFDDNPLCTLPRSDKAAQLRAQEHSWLFVKPKFETTVRVAHLPGGVYDLMGGVYLLGNKFRDMLYWLKLPEHAQEDPVWKPMRFEKEIIDMGLCVYENDLLAVVTTSTSPTDPRRDCIELDLFELSTGRPHPSANRSTIRVLEPEATDVNAGIAIEIVGDHFVLAISSRRVSEDSLDHVLVYNWRTGVLKASRTTASGSYASLVFLTPSTFMLPNASTGQLELYDIPSNPLLRPLSPRCIFSLPDLADDHFLAALTCRSDPNPIATPTQAHFRKPFQPSPNDALINFTYRTLPRNMPFGIGFHWGSVFTFVVHRSTLTNLYRSAVESNPDCMADKPFSVPYASWGPKTRWNNAEAVSTRWITTANGQRCVKISGRSRQLGSRYMVLDFNPNNVKKAKAWLQHVERVIQQLQPETRSSPIPRTDDPLPDDDVLQRVDRLDPATPYFLEDLMNVSLEEAPGDFDVAPAVPPLGSFDVPVPPHVPGPTSSPSKVALLDSPIPRPPSVIQVSDEPYLASLHAALKRMYVVETPSPLPSAQIFKEPDLVNGSLPYVVSLSETIHHWDGVLLDHQHVLGLRADDFQRIKYVDIHGFSCPGVPTNEESD